MDSTAKRPYDAVLVVSFGGPEKREDVLPFLENVLRGRNVPHERMREVAEHYYHFDGASPIAEQTRNLIANLQQELEGRGPHLCVYGGNRNWHPMLADTLRVMAGDGVRRALAFVTSAFGSYSGCRQYIEDIERARAEVGAQAPSVEKLRLFYDHPGFLAIMAERTHAAVDLLPTEMQSTARVLFTAHGIPTAMASTGPYESQLKEACASVAQMAGVNAWQLVYQSRSGPPSQKWLEPDLTATLRDIAASGEERAAVVIVPIGFLTDHMEVKYDLDTEAAQICRELGLTMARAQTAGDHPRFSDLVRELIVEHIRRDAAGLPPLACADGCCRRS